MECVTVTITTDTPISVKVIKNEENNGLTALLKKVKSKEGNVPKRDCLMGIK